MLQATLNQPPWRPKEGEAATHHTARKAEETSTPRRQRERTAANSPPPATSAGQEQHARRATRRFPSPPRHLGRPGEEERRRSPPTRSTGEHGLIQGELAPDTHTAIGSHLESTAARWQEATPPDLTGEIWGHPPARSATYRHSGLLQLRGT
jgi:hypothetical protein